MQSSEVINESLTGVFDTAVLRTFIQVISREQAVFDEHLKNIYDAVEGCLSVDVKDIQISANYIDRKIV